MKGQGTARVRQRKDLSALKPEGFQNYLTLAELCAKLSRDPSWIRHLERTGKIPVAHRVPMGSVQMRLWSPHQVIEIQEILSRQKKGRPRRAN